MIASRAIYTDWNCYLSYEEHQQEIYEDFKQIVHKTINSQTIYDPICFIYTYNIEKNRLYPSCEKIFYINKKDIFNDLYLNCMNLIPNKTLANRAYMELYMFYILDRPTIHFYSYRCGNLCMFLAYFRGDDIATAPSTP